MYIEPSTNIRLLKDVPLDNTYKHSIYFETPALQRDYFISKQKYNLINYSYQRVKRGVARVGIKADSIYDCNYLMFQNSAYGDKWFYAFINSIEYINDVTSEIQFEIDAIQSWLFNATPDICFVEREHSVTDEIGENIVPENVDTGEYFFNDNNNLLPNLQKLGVIVLVNDTNNSSGTLLDGVFSGCVAHAFKVDDSNIESLKNFISGYVENYDAIVAIYMCPIFNMGGVIDDGGTILSYNSKAEYTRVASYQLNSEHTLNGYKPINKKLYTYPYNFFNVSNTNGGNLIIRYEFCNNLIPEFRITGTITPPVQVQLRPLHYKGMTEYNPLMTESLTLDNYPQCSFVIDAFKAWFAQQGVPQILDFGINAVSGLAFNGVQNLAVGGAKTAGSLLSNGYRASIASDIGRGNLNHGSMSCANGEQTFFGGRMSINAQTAKIIDDYFTMYGYATNRMKTPNISSRPHWNYVKTIDATITGSAPADDLRKIESAYNNGITFWKNGNEVGDYSLDNRPV